MAAHSWKPVVLWREEKDRLIRDVEEWLGERGEDV